MLGQHTVFDLQNCVTAADRELAGLGRGYTALMSAHEMPPDWRQAWERDYQGLRVAYADARRVACAKVIAAKDMPGVRTDLIPAEEQYRALRKSLATFREMRSRLALAAGGTSNFGADPPSFPATGTVTTHDTGAAGTLNVRKTPSPQGAKVGSLQHLQKIAITGPSENGFYPISSGTLTGYASASFITPDMPGILVVPVPGAPAPSPATPAPVGSIAIVTTAQTGVAGRLKVHKDPSLASAQVGMFQHAQQVQITGPVVAGFYPVAGANEQGRPITGWASTQFLTPQGGAAPAPQAPQPGPQKPATPQAPGTPSPAPGAPKAPLALPAANDDDTNARRRLLAIGALLGLGGIGYVALRKKRAKKGHATA